MSTGTRVDLGLLVIRIGLGATMFAHGSQKLFGWFGGHGVKGTAAGMEHMGYQPARVSAVGEPWLSHFVPAELESALADSGFAFARDQIQPVNVDLALRRLNVLAATRTFVQSHATLLER